MENGAAVESLGSSKALTHGLEILKILAEAPGALTSTEIARRVGLHQSTASRILKTLASAGYVHKPDYHSFTVDYGVLTLGAGAIQHFPIISKGRAAVQAVAEKANGLAVSLATLWRGQLVYLLRAQHGHELTVITAGYPLHLSSVALRLLLDVPAGEALAMLAESKRRYGWERPGPAVPATPAACLKAARERVQHDALVLDAWQGEGKLSAAIPLAIGGRAGSALALSGPTSALPIEKALLLLQDGRRALEMALRADAKQ